MEDVHRPSKKRSRPLVKYQLKEKLFNYYAAYQHRHDNWNQFKRWAYRRATHFLDTSTKIDDLMPHISYEEPVPQNLVKFQLGIGAVRAACRMIGLEELYANGIHRTVIINCGLHNDRQFPDPKGKHYTVEMQDAKGKKKYSRFHAYPEAKGIHPGDVFARIPSERVSSMPKRRKSSSAKSAKSGWMGEMKF